eukprot:11227331-Lingulodinium_polyedra.AAC.1
MLSARRLTEGPLAVASAASPCPREQITNGGYDGNKNNAGNGNELAMAIAAIAVATAAVAAVV